MVYFRQVNLLLFSTQCLTAPWRLYGELYRPDGGEQDFRNTAGVKHKLWEFTQTRNRNSTTAVFTSQGICPEFIPLFIPFAACGSRS